jgi:hypothetical protein
LSAPCKAREISRGSLESSWENARQRDGPCPASFGIATSGRPPASTATGASSSSAASVPASSDTSAILSDEHPIPHASANASHPSEDARASSVSS